MKNTIDIITKQENKDTFIANLCLETIFQSKKNLNVTVTPYGAAVDLNCSVDYDTKTIPFNVEIKERFKSEETLKKYPYAELRVDKLERMRKETPEGTSLLYMVLLNEERCLVFNLNKLDWSKVKTFDWWIKKTQVDPNSGYTKETMYNIPYNLASVNISCSEYYKQFYN